MYKAHRGQEKGGSVVWAGVGYTFALVGVHSVCHGIELMNGACARLGIDLAFVGLQS